MVDNNKLATDVKHYGLKWNEDSEDYIFQNVDKDIIVEKYIKFFEEQVSKGNMVKPGKVITKDIPFGKQYTETAEVTDRKAKETITYTITRNEFYLFQILIAIMIIIILMILVAMLI